ncbi:RAB6-interacting golgin-like isoform X2 [Saccostrea echinata]|uniref:RAB6-interacting golgin-like isoform X2 n=1 Tax=Saccostrea echinata TaxID=191078 RepID=UPI002A80265C|nr:RAB6-interacting golgin-like isoform X2 [Saccostrea echinata]
MSGWAGFSDAELRKLKEKSPSKLSPAAPELRNEALPERRVPNILSASKARMQKETTANQNSSAGGNKIPKQQTQVPSPKPEEHIEIKEEVTEIDDSEALSREMNNLDKFRDQQKMIEEANKQRKALLSKTLTERQRKAREEAQKLSHIQKEVQLLDNRLSADVTLIRSRIESASKDYMEAQRRYDRAEREFIEAKMDLQKKSDLKEQLTEHLYTIIHQNELRKAEKLSQLMNELHVEMESEEEGVKLATLPPLSAFNSVSLPTLHRTRSHDPSQNGAPSTKDSNQKSSDSSENTAAKSVSTGHVEEAKDRTVCSPATESQNGKEKVVNDCAKGKQNSNETSVSHENFVQQGTSEINSDGKINTEKPVPTSWTLDVIIKQEPEDGV